jgi:hypothetical protein
MSRTCLVALLLTTAASAQSGSIATTFLGGNSQDGCMFNLKSTCDLTVTAFDVSFQDLNNPAPCGTACSVTEVEVYRAPGGFSPIAMTPGAWTLLGNVQHTTSTGPRIPQPLSLPINTAFDAVNPKFAFYVTNTGDTNTLTGLPNELIDYTNATSPGESYTNGSLEIVAGSGNDYPFGQVFKPRLANVGVHFTQSGGCTGCLSNPTSYCTGGTSASGCKPTLKSVGTASATLEKGFIVYTTGLEGNKDGIFFYGQNGRQAAPWGNGSSFQCVSPPVKRSPLRNGTGTTGQCDGWAQNDMNATWCPTCPKNSPIVGQKLQIQFWYRDPQNTSNQTTSLTNALEVDICP